MATLRKHFLNQEQLESLTSPTRLAIVQRLEIDRQATARELAHRMDRQVTSLYHHLKQLQRVGLLTVMAQRKGARRPEAVYAMVADSLSSAKATKTSEGKEAYARAAARIADAGARAFSAAMGQEAPRFEGARRNAMARFYTLRATRNQLARLNELLDELDDTARSVGDDGEGIQLTILLSPFPSKIRGGVDGASGRRRTIA
jgi:predicted ArsR family transcriptional regulator